MTWRSGSPHRSSAKCTWTVLPAHRYCWPYWPEDNGKIRYSSAFPHMPSPRPYPEALRNKAWISPHSLPPSAPVIYPPSKSQDFKEQVSAASCSIVLISSNDSSCYWQDTPGHYVTIFLYDKETDTVFLADSGNPDHNRQKVELRKIYKSLKKASEWQYLTIGDYDSTKDTWKHRKSDGNWVKPEYVN